MKGFDRPIICGALMERSEEDFLRSAALAKEMGVDCLEIRVDGLQDPTPSAAKDLLRKIKEETGLTLILTCRIDMEGGQFHGSEDDRMEVLKEAIPEADLVDIELRTDHDARSGVVEEARKQGTGVICSYHSFSRTPGPDVLMSVFEGEFEAGADVAKVAVMVKDPSEVLTLLEAGHRASARGQVCAIPMGEAGKAGRMAAPFFGSVLNYGYVTRETGPGQLSVEELRTLFDIMGI